MREQLVRTLKELEEEVARFIDNLTPSEGGATLVTLSGELGAGKTAFAKAVAKALGVAEPVTSPTFVLEKIYTLPQNSGHRKSRFKRLVHIDAYRLEDAAELAPLGFDELMRDSGNLVMIEWPERVADALPAPVKHVALATRSDGAHTISYG